MSTSTGNSPASFASRQRRARNSQGPTPPRGSSTSTSPRKHECGWRACGFIQDLCRNTLGPSAGQYIILREWQHEILHGLFTKAGRPAHRYAYIGLPRKNGKSTLGAALGLYALVAMGENGAQVYSCAGDRKQASIVFDEAKRMVLAEPELAEVVRIQRWHLEGPNGGIYRVLSADAQLQQGLNPSFVIFDEVHVQRNRDLWDAMILGMGARAAPMIVGITTAGWDRSSLAWDLYERGKRGEFYFWWKEPASASGDWRDPAVWYEANPALGDFLHEVALVEDAKVTPEASFRRYHLNQWTNTALSWLPFGEWDKLARPRQVDPKEPVVFGFDGAWSNDSTGLVGCAVNDQYLWVEGLWTPDANLGHVDMARIERDIRASLSRYNVKELAFDPARFQDFFARLEGERYPVVEFHTNSPARMVPACQDFYSAVLEGEVSHDASVELTQHIGNAVVKEDRLGPRIVKESKSSSRKIDLAVAAVIAYARSRNYANTKKPSRLLTF